MKKNNLKERPYAVNKSIFEGETLNVVYLEHTPAVLKISDSEMIGLEVQILKALTQVMNFKTLFYKTEDSVTEKWGRKLENDTLTGLIRHMVSKFSLFLTILSIQKISYQQNYSMKEELILHLQTYIIRHIIWI